jgi:hypothetical protein
MNRRQFLKAIAASTAATARKATSPEAVKRGVIKKIIGLKDDAKAIKDMTEALGNKGNQKMTRREFLRGARKRAGHYLVRYRDKARAAMRKIPLPGFGGNPLDPETIMKYEGRKLPSIVDKVTKIPRSFFKRKSRSVWF